MFFQLVEAKPMRVIEKPSGKNVVLPASVSGKQHLPLPPRVLSAI
jgi:hypothetical protein